MFYWRMQNIPYIMDDYLWSRAIEIKKKTVATHKKSPEPVDAVFKMYTL